MELQRRLGATVLYVTHDQVEAMTMGARIAILHEGALEQVGPPADIYRRPTTVFVARFIGSPPMNTMTGTVRGQPGALRVTLPGGDVELPSPASQAVAASGCAEVVVGVRPEHLTVSDAGDLPATVVSVEALGYERHVFCQLDDGEMITVRISADAPEPSMRSPVRLGIDAAQVHCFDPTTTRRIDW